MIETPSVDKVEETKGAKAWVKPELRKLEAGAAESNGAVNDDGVVGNS